jgi:hypothetical protein
MSIRVGYKSWIAAVTIAGVYFLGCNTAVNKQQSNDSNVQWQLHRLQTYDSLFPIIAAKIKSGDMITRLGTDITSEMLRQMNQTDQSFSHCGIASIEHDTIFVYHAIGGEFNPDQKVKREPLYSFGHPTDNKSLGIFVPQLDSAQLGKAVAAAQKAYAAGLPFDMAFDYTTNDRQYCAEFVAKAFSHAKSDSGWFQFSINGQFKYVAVDNLSRTAFMKEAARYSY